MTNADYADDLVVLANTPAQVEPLLHNQWHPTERIGCYVNAPHQKNPTDFVCFKWKEAGSISRGKSLKLEDQFIYSGSNNLSTESDVNIYKAKA